MVGVVGSSQSCLPFILPLITLPDNTKKSFSNPIKVIDLAKSISPSLAKRTICGNVNDTLVDTDFLIQVTQQLNY